MTNMDMVKTFQKFSGTGGIDVNETWHGTLGNQVLQCILYGHLTWIYKS